MWSSGGRVAGFVSVGDGEKGSGCGGGNRRLLLSLSLLLLLLERNGIGSKVVIVVPDLWRGERCVRGVVGGWGLACRLAAVACIVRHVHIEDGFVLDVVRQDVR